jgi:hypothetical protein
MTRTIILDTPAFRLVSYGNWTACEFINKAAQASVFFQGEDALMFGDEMEGRTLADLWNDYEDVANLRA